MGECGWGWVQGHGHGALMRDAGERHHRAADARRSLLQAMCSSSQAHRHPPLRTPHRPRGKCTAAVGVPPRAWHGAFLGVCAEPSKPGSSMTSSPLPSFHMEEICPTHTHAQHPHRARGERAPWPRRSCKAPSSRSWPSTAWPRRYVQGLFVWCGAFLLKFTDTPAAAQTRVTRMRQAATTPSMPKARDSSHLPLLSIGDGGRDGPDGCDAQGPARAPCAGRAYGLPGRGGGLAQHHEEHRL